MKGDFMHDIIDILVSFGGGKGGEASGTVVRFLLPTFFWLVLAFISGSEWRRKQNSRDLYMALAALAGSGREMLMFLAEYGSSRGHFTFEIFYRYYPPLEHAATMLVGILISYAFMRYGDSSKKLQVRFLTISLAVTVILYVTIATGWSSYVLLHPKISFALYWGDLVFRISNSLILGIALVAFTTDRMLGGRVSISLMFGMFFFFLDEILMIVNIITREQFVSVFAPIRHNLHIWAIPFFIATYWSELKYQTNKFEVELEEQHRKLAEINSNLEDKISSAVAELKQRDWFNSGLNGLNAVLRGDKNLHELAEQILGYVVKYIDASVGAFYDFSEDDRSLQVLSTYALMGESRLNKRIPIGEGLAGQVAKSSSMIKLSPVPVNYLPIGSALGESSPIEIIVMPICCDGKLVAVFELGSFKNFSNEHCLFLSQAADVIGTAVSVNHSRQLVNELLEQTQSQTEELRVQQEELQQTNEELSERAAMLAGR